VANLSKRFDRLASLDWVVASKCRCGTIYRRGIRVCSNRYFGWHGRGFDPILCSHRCDPDSS
jgi:hypothetical protein